MLCPNCGTDNVPGIDLCESCGSDLAGLDLEAGEGFRGHLLSGRLTEMSLVEPLALGPAATVLEAIERMREQRHGCVLVTEGGRLCGIFTERDVLVRVLRAGKEPATTALSEVMTPEPFTLQEDDPPVFAIHRMVGEGFRHLPVLAGDELRGFVSVRNVLRYVHETVLGEPEVLPEVAGPPDADDETASLLGLLARLGAAELESRTDGATMRVAVVAVGGERRIVLLERSYREGVRVIVDPTDEELELARGGDGWTLWNSDRTRLLTSAI